MPTGAEIMAGAAIILQDDEHVRWPLPELADWINDGVRAVLLAKPSAGAQSLVLPLAQGTRQTLTDASHFQLLRVVRNISAEGPPRIGGRAVRAVSREALDTAEPRWHDPVTVRYRPEVRQICYDEADPRVFYAYPGNDGLGMIEAEVAVIQAPLAPSGDAALIASYAAELGLAEPWRVAVLEWVLYRALSKDAMGGDPGRAALHLQAFSTAVGVKLQAEGSNSPNSRARIATT